MSIIYFMLIGFLILFIAINFLKLKQLEDNKYTKPKKLPLKKVLKTYQQPGNKFDYPQKNKPETSTVNQPIKEGMIKWNLELLKELEWKLYEDVCKEYLKIKNCNADVTCIGADGGMDMKVSDKNGNIIAVAQCKAWNKPIGVSLIRELFGVMASERVKHGIFLTTSVYSNDAKEFARGKPLILMDGEEFVKVINELDDENKRKIDKLIYKGDHKTPTCVNCNVKLIKRTTKTGPNAGREFWGCANYPRCKIKMNIRSD